MQPCGEPLVNFLNLRDKTFLIAGVANKKSVAYFVAKTLIESDAKIILTVQTNEHAEAAKKLFDCPIIICDVSNAQHLKDLAQEVKKYTNNLSGVVHSLAFARFDITKPNFLDTPRENFLEAAQVSCFSFNELCSSLKPVLDPEASCVTISISSTKATSYGFLGPIKAMLDATVPFMAKAFSEFSKIRVNAVGAGPLKTSASAGIPDYIENYLYAEELTLRKKALETQEVANTVAFLLSSKSSGINATTIIVDAGMSSNYFDQKIVKSFAKDKI
jgi:enoyl-[acyl-carrier protein] reductase I